MTRVDSFRGAEAGGGASLVTGFTALDEVAVVSAPGWTGGAGASGRMRPGLQHGWAPGGRTPWDRLVESVQSWGALRDDWDGDDGQPPSAHAVEEARKFLNAARWRKFPLPTLARVSGDGEIEFRWREGADGFASVGFAGAAMYHYVIGAGSNVPVQGDADACEASRAVVLKALESFHAP